MLYRLACVIECVAYHGSSFFANHPRHCLTKAHHTAKQLRVKPVTPLAWFSTGVVATPFRTYLARNVKAVLSPVRRIEKLQIATVTRFIPETCAVGLIDTVRQESHENISREAIMVDSLLEAAHQRASATNVPVR